MDNRAHEAQDRRLARNRILSRIGLFLIVLSLGSWGISIVLTSRSTPTKPPPNPIVGNNLTPTPVTQPTIGEPDPTPVTQPTTVEPNPTPTATTTSTPTATTTSTPTAPPSAALMVIPTNLDTTNCTPDGAGNWICTVSLTSNSQNDVSWSANSTLAVENFTPQNGVLLPGQSQPVTISSIPCQNDNFSFSSAGALTAVTTWNCTPTPTPPPIGIIQIPTPTSIPQTGTNQIVSNTTISNIKMVSAWPPMSKDQSVIVAVSLIVTHNLSIQLTATAKEEKTSYTKNDDLIPVGTPEASIRNAFGPGYKVYATAHLESSAFEISSAEQNSQTLDQRVVSFYWDVLPKEAGQQTLLVTMMGQWRSGNGKGPEDLPLGHALLPIEVGNSIGDSAPPVFTIGQFSLSGFFGSFGSIIGTGCTAPWIYDKIQEARKKRKSNQNTATSEPKASLKPPGSRQKKKRR